MEGIGESLESTFNKKPETAISPVGDKQDTPIRQSDDTRLLKGYLTLETISPFNQEQGGVPEWLARVYGLKVISTSRYASGNRWITKHNLELEHEMPLLKILEEMPAVKDVDMHNENIVVILR